MVGPLVEPADELSPHELARYARQAVIPDLGSEGQRRLKAASVLCVGAGGLGSPALLYLAAAGVGRLGVIDDDVVELTNLHRQVLHGESDLDQPKTGSAARALADVNPHVAVEEHRTRIGPDNAVDLVSAYDVVLDGTDNFATRDVVNRACVAAGKPYVWGSVLRFDGQLSTFWAGPPADGPCYRCVYPVDPPVGSVPSCAEAGVVGALCGVIGSLMATEVVRLVTGVGEPLIGRLLLHDSRAATWREVAVGKDPDCAVCGTGCEGEPMDVRMRGGPADPGERVARATIDVHELKARLDRGDDFVLVDVREPFEAEIVSIPGGTLIPNGRIMDGTALGALPHDRPVVLYCRSGARSADALLALQDAGFEDVEHVGGGVIAWVREIEPDKPLY